MDAVVVGVVEAEELPVARPNPSTPRRIPDGKLPGTLISRHSIRARSTGPGVKVVISVESQIHAHGESSLHPKPIIEVPTSLLLLLTKNLFIVCYTRRIKKYMKLL